MVIDGFVHDLTKRVTCLSFTAESFEEEQALTRLAVAIVRDRDAVLHGVGDARIRFSAKPKKKRKRNKS